MRFIQDKKLTTCIFQPHVEVTLSTSNDTIIKSVLIFAEGIFEVKQFPRQSLVHIIFFYRERVMLFIPKSFPPQSPSPYILIAMFRSIFTSKPLSATNPRPTSTCLSWPDSCRGSPCTRSSPTLAQTRGESPKAGSSFSPRSECRELWCGSIKTFCWRRN